MSITRAQAWDLLKQYNEEPFHLRHAITVEHVMGWFADKLGYGDEKEFWSIVGLLHDLDFERWPEEHCEKSQELMREAGVDTLVLGFSFHVSNAFWRFCTTQLSDSIRKPPFGRKIPKTERLVLRILL